MTQICTELESAHLEALFAQQRGAAKKQAIILEISNYSSTGGKRDALELILVARAPVSEARAIAIRSELDGHFEFEYDGDQFLEGIQFSEKVVGDNATKTRATVEAFARRHGFASVLTLPDWDDGSFARHFLLTKAPASKAPQPFAALEESIIPVVAAAISQWAIDNESKVQNVALYFNLESGDVPGALEIIYLNVRAKKPGDLTKLIDFEGTELPPEAELGLDGTVVKSEKQAVRFAHRLAARLEKDTNLKRALSPGAWVMPLFHDARELSQSKLLDEARASLEAGADAFMTKRQRKG